MTYGVAGLSAVSESMTGPRTHGESIALGNSREPPAFPHVSVARALGEIPRGQVKRPKAAPLQIYLRSLRIFAATCSFSEVRSE
jgi:hypothetical protein